MQSFFIRTVFKSNSKKSLEIIHKYVYYLKFTSFIIHEQKANTGFYTVFKEVLVF